MCWQTGETNIGDGHCPSSLPKPQTQWQQENHSGSDQGLCNPDPGRACAGGSGDSGDRLYFRGQARHACILRAASYTRKPVRSTFWFKLHQELELEALPLGSSVQPSGAGCHWWFSVTAVSTAGTDAEAFCPTSQSAPQ